MTDRVPGACLLVFELVEDIVNRKRLSVGEVILNCLDK